VGKFFLGHQLSVENHFMLMFSMTATMLCFVAQPGWGGTGGNVYFAFRRTPKGWRFLGTFSVHNRVASKSLGRNDG